MCLQLSHTENAWNFIAYTPQTPMNFRNNDLMRNWPSSLQCIASKILLYFALVCSKILLYLTPVCCSVLHQDIVMSDSELLQCIEPRYHCILLKIVSVYCIKMHQNIVTSYSSMLQCIAPTSHYCLLPATPCHRASNIAAGTMTLWGTSLNLQKKWRFRCKPSLFEVLSVTVHDLLPNRACVCVFMCIYLLPHHCEPYCRTTSSSLIT